LTLDTAPSDSPSGLGIRGAPPPGSLGGPLVALASARSGGPLVGRGSDAGAPDLGRGAPLTAPRAVDTAGRAVVRIVPNPPDGKTSPAADGFGFLVDARGYVLTHDHLVRNAKNLKVVLADGRSLPVKQVWRDQLAGVAVLKVDGSRLPAVPLGESSALRVGDHALLVGWTTAAQPLTARATIRATGSATGGNLSIDAPVSAEYAGGPLVDLQGQVVGIATSDGQISGSAIPIDRAKSMLRQAQSASAAQIRSPAQPTR
jgi:S1-C subfamily serine protease